MKLFKPEATFELRSQAYEHVATWPRAVALIGGEFSADGAPRILIEAMEQAVDHLLLLELANKTTAQQDLIIGATTTPPLMWGRKIKMLERLLQMPQPPILNVWGDETIWDEVQREFASVRGWFSHSKAPSILGLWPLVQLRNDVIHRRQTHTYDSAVLWRVLHRLMVAFRSTKLVYVSRCEPIGSNCCIEYLDYCVGTALPRPLRIELDQTERSGWALLREGSVSRGLVPVPWIRQARSRNSTWQFDYELDFTIGRSR
jgi:hypothetical protein